jgi:hypothetical protein
LLLQIGQREPVIREARIAPATLVRERQRRRRIAVRSRRRRELGGEHVQEAKERRSDPIDAALADLDDRPLAVGARLFGVERKAPTRPLHDRPEARGPGRRAPAVTLRLGAPLRRLGQREDLDVRAEDAAVVRAEKRGEAGRRAPCHRRLEPRGRVGPRPGKQRRARQPGDFTLELADERLCRVDHLGSISSTPAARQPSPLPPHPFRARPPKRRKSYGPLSRPYSHQRSPTMLRLHTRDRRENRILKS